MSRISRYSWRCGIAALFMANTALAQTHGVTEHPKMGHGGTNHEAMKHNSTGHGAMQHSEMDHNEGKTGRNAEASAHKHIASHHLPTNSSKHATEPGQGAFAALSEIVRILSADMTTDWSRVNFSGLREHLVDMDKLITETEVREEAIEGGLKMHIALAGRQGEAALRMLPAHSSFMSMETAWASDLEQSGNTFIWSVTTSKAAEVAKIRALGFFGIMATGDHHRAHHLALARGESVH